VYHGGFLDYWRGLALYAGQPPPGTP